MTTIAVLCPGQGAQLPGMGTTLQAVHGAAREVYEIAHDVLGFDLLQAAQNHDGEFTDTRIVQPALVAYGIAAWRTLAALTGAEPRVFAGHSLGELTALACAGAWDAATAIGLAAARAELMAGCPSGKMAVVFGPSAQSVAELCNAVGADRVTVANRNSPEQCVISGEAAAVDAVAIALTRLRAVVKPLKISVATHSPLMASATAGFAAALGRADIRPAFSPVVSSVTGEMYSDPADVRAGLPIALTACVDWPRTVQAVRALGADTFVEVGPKTVLRDLSIAIDPGVTAMSCAEGLSTVAQRLGTAVAGADPGSLESVLAACLRVAVGTPNYQRLRSAELRAEVLDPYAAIRAELDEVRAGTDVPRPSASRRAGAHLELILRAKGLPPEQVGELVAQCVGGEA